MHVLTFGDKKNTVANLEFIIVEPIDIERLKFTIRGLLQVILPTQEVGAIILSTNPSAPTYEHHEDGRIYSLAHRSASGFEAQVMITNNENNYPFMGSNYIRMWNEIQTMSITRSHLVMKNIDGLTKALAAHSMRSAGMPIEAVTMTDWYKHNGNYKMLAGKSPKEIFVIQAFAIDRSLFQVPGNVNLLDREHTIDEYEMMEQLFQPQGAFNRQLGNTPYAKPCFSNTSEHPGVLEKFANCSQLFLPTDHVQEFISLIEKPMVKLTSMLDLERTITAMGCQTLITADFIAQLGKISLDTTTVTNLF